MSDYLALLANCTLHGIEFTTGEKDGRPWKSRNLIKLNVGGFELELHQENDLPLNRHKLSGQFVATTKLYVRNVTEKDVSRLQEVIDHACDLLSFATESRVMAYGHEYPVGSRHGRQISVRGTIQHWRPPFDDPGESKRFVESCFDEFVRLRDRRKLHVVIDYIHHSILSGLAAEVQIGLACVTFENLRHNWALDSGYPHIDGFFRTKGSCSKKDPVVGFKAHLVEMFKEVGMTSDPEKIVNTRNEVIHTGLYGNLHNDDIHDFLETALREYFLRLVGYKGTFMPYVGGSPVPHQI